jgi:hypothetical protein
MSTSKKNSKSNVDTKKEVVLVIGGGFLGRWICDKFLDNDYDVKVFDIRKPFDDDRILEFCIGDLRKPSDLQSALQGVDAVVRSPLFFMSLFPFVCDYMLDFFYF